MSGLAGSFSDFARDYQRRRVDAAAATRFAAFNNRLDKLPEISEVIAKRGGANRTTWNVRHSPEAHMQCLRNEGFKECEEIWRYLSYSMVMGIR